MKKATKVGQPSVPCGVAGSFSNLLYTKGLGPKGRTQNHNPLVHNHLQPKKNFQKTCLVIDKIPPMVSNTTMKNRNIYTLTLDYTREGEPKRITRWVRQTHREAMRKLRQAQERGDGSDERSWGVYPLQRWQLDSGWQNPEDLIR